MLPAASMTLLCLQSMIGLKAKVLFPLTRPDNCVSVTFGDVIRGSSDFTTWERYRCSDWSLLEELIGDWNRL